MKTIYVDNAATTKVRQEVLDVMTENNEHYGNPSSIHTMGQNANDLINTARKQIANSINAKTNEIIFTSSGTEADGLAIQGYSYKNVSRGNHIITTSIEHAAVLNTAKYLYHEGYEITYLPVNNDGIIDIQQLRKSIRRGTILISIIFANNEIGTIQPIQKIGEIAKQHNIKFHVDAVQAFGHCDINVNKLNIDMMSVSGHKIYAPKGIGVLYVKNDIELTPLIHGGGQEYGLRSGTENVNSIVGMGKAVELLNQSERIENTNKIFRLKDRFIREVIRLIPDVKLNGSIEHGLPGIVNFSFKGVMSETLLTQLSSRGIYASNGAACSSNILKPSHVLRAIGLSDDLAYSSLRFSFGKYNTENDVDYILEILPELIKNLRKDEI